MMSPEVNLLHSDQSSCSPASLIRGPRRYIRKLVAQDFLSPSRNRCRCRFILRIFNGFLAFFFFSDAKSRQKNLQNVEKRSKKSLKAKKIAKKIIKSPKKFQKKPSTYEKRSTQVKVNLKKTDDESYSRSTKLPHSVSVRW